MVMTFGDADTGATLAELREKEAAVVVSDDRPERVAVKPAAKAAKDEALGKPVTFEYDGKNYVLEPAQEWDFEVFRLLNTGDISDSIEGVELLLGKDQLNAFKTDADGKRIKRTMEDFGKFVEFTMAQLGANSAESNS